MLTQTHNLGVVFTAVSLEFSKIMHANHVLGPDSGVIVADNLNDGLDFCENELLEEAKVGFCDNTAPFRFFSF